MVRVRHVLFAVVTSFLLINPANAQSLNPDLSEALLEHATSWTNQSGSVADISFSKTSVPDIYQVTGTFLNNASGFGCRGTPYQLVGSYYAGTQTISFTVAWSNSTANCQSVTGWTGYIDLSVSPLTMTTDWNLAHIFAAEHQISRGADIFQMYSTVTHNSLIPSQ